MITEAAQVPHLKAEQHPDRRMQEFMVMAQYQADQELPQNGDMYTKSFEITFAGYLTTNQKFRQIYEGLFIDNPSITADNLIRQNIKTFQFIERTLNPALFPTNRATPESWEGPMEALMQDEDYQLRFDTNIYLPLASNVSERGSSIKAAMLLHGMQYPDVFDGGSSRGDLLKRMELEQDPDLAYNPIQIMRRSSNRGKTIYTLDEVATDNFNNFMAPARLALGNCLNTDIIDFERDSNARDRAFSDSHYMGELVMSKLAQRADILEHVQPTNIGFKCLDAATMNLNDVEQQYDAVIYSTMLYESANRPEDVKSILQNGRDILKNDGKIFVQDFIKRVLKSGEIQFYKRWPAYSYGLWVEDKQRPELGLQKYFTIYSGRIEAMVPEPALEAIPLAHELGLVGKKVRF